MTSVDSKLESSNLNLIQMETTPIVGSTMETEISTACTTSIIPMTADLEPESVGNDSDSDSSYFTVPRRKLSNPENPTVKMEESNSPISRRKPKRKMIIDSDSDDESIDHNQPLNDESPTKETEQTSRNSFKRIERSPIINGKSSNLISSDKESDDLPIISRDITKSDDICQDTHSKLPRPRSSSSVSSISSHESDLKMSRASSRNSNKSISPERDRVQTSWKKLIDSDDEGSINLLPINEDYSYPLDDHSKSKKKVVGFSKTKKTKKTLKTKNGKPSIEELTQKQREKLFKDTLSKTQEMIREKANTFALPYERPKQLTLSEFLQKRAQAKAEFYNPELKKQRQPTPPPTASLDLEKLEQPLALAKVEDWINNRSSDVIVSEDEEMGDTKDNDFTIDDLGLKDKNDGMKNSEQVDENSTKMVDSAVTAQTDGQNENVTLLEPELTSLDISLEVVNVNISEKTDVEDLSVEIITIESIAAEIIPAEVIPAEVIPAEVIPAEVIPAEVIPAEVIPAEVIHAEVIHAEIIHAEIIPAEIIPAETIVVETIVVERMEESATSIVDLSNEKEPEIVNLEEEINLLDREAAEKDFQAKEAALEAYLEALKPKPPRIRKSIADLLKNDPGFAKIADLKPTINPGPKGFIEFSSPKTKRSKSHRNVQNLIDRFRKHTSVVKKPKEKHFTVVVTNKEEDSQGNEKSIVDKVDYVQHLDDEDEILDTTISPLRQTAGAKFCQFLEKLQIDMRAKKTKEYEEKMKNHSLYEDEKFEKNPEEEEEEEVLEDDFSTESEPELTDEEAEAIRSALRKKKKRKVKSAFVEDEAEVSDSTNQGSDDEDESTSETEIDLTQKLKSYKRVQLLEDSSDESDVEIITLDEEEPTEVTSTLLNSSEIEMIVPKEDPDLLSLPESQTFLEHAQRFTSQSDTLFLPLIECPSSQLEELNPAQVSIMMSPQPGSNSETQEILTDASQITSSHREIMKLIETPLILPFSSETQLDVFSPTISSQCSAMMPRFDSEAALDAFKEDMPFPTMSQPLSKEISKLVSNSEKNSPDLLVLCSGIFPSQNPSTPEDSPCMFPDSPTEDETGIIKNTLKDQFLDSPAEGETRIVTRSLKAQDTTPKVLEKEKLNKTRLFTRMESFNFESESDDDNNEQEGIGLIVKKRKQHRRLKFSDDEDEEEEKPIQEKEEEEELKIIESDVEQGYDSEENEIIIPKASFKGFVSKEGKLRRQFVENEAELSGSEDGSADEDERGLDEMEEEEGDTEEIDDEVLREQIGKAHIRNLIDDDDRQIRLLQDVLLEDGDLHGEGNIREKQFKWKHIDLLDEFGDRKLEEGLEVEPDEDAAERLWKEQKAEKVKWMKENSHLSQKNEIDSEEEDSQKIFLENSKYFKLGKSTLRKIRSSCSMTESSSLSGNSCSESMMLSENTTGTGEMNLRKIGIHSQLLFASPENPILKIKHGSFLARGKCLARLAEMTKGADESSSTVNNNSRNFVFSVITPPGPEVVSGKRKKSFTRHPTNQNQPRKMPRIDRSFESLDAATKAASIFSQY